MMMHDNGDGQGIDLSSRRGFIKGAAGVVAMGALPMVGMGKSVAIEVPKWTIACRDAHLDVVRGADGKPLSSSWAAMKAIGVEGVEVGVDMDFRCHTLKSPDGEYHVKDEAGIRRLMDDVKKQGLKISAFCLHNKFDEKPDKEVEFTAKMAMIAAGMGVRAIRVDIVPRKLKVDDPKFLELAIRCMSQIVEKTETTDVRFGVENHGTWSNDPANLRPMFKGVGSKRFGLTLDTANFYWFGWPLEKLYDIYEEFAPTACHTHCKSVAYPKEEQNKRRSMGWEYGKYNCPVYAGDIDFKKLATILRKAKYTGDLCIENESLGKFPEAERGDVLKKEVALLREVAEVARKDS